MSADSRAEAARRAQLLRYTQLQRRQRELIIRALEESKAAVLKSLTGQPSDWQRYRLRTIEQAIDGALTRFQARQIGNWTEGVDIAWALGQSLVESPLTAAGFSGAFNRLDDRLLTSIRTFMVRKISDITIAQRTAITAQLNLAATGGQPIGAAIAGISQVFAGDRQRAITITRTELGRAHSAATYLRLKQAAERDPDLKKQWRRSGKLHSRQTHDHADGQVKEVNDWFLIGGEKMLYPRDPTASAKNTINCGCTMLPFKKSWAVVDPGPRPFTPAEIAQQPSRADVTALMQEKINDARAAMTTEVAARFGGLLTAADAAYAHLSAPLAQALKTQEAQLLNGPVERGAIFAPDGKELWAGIASPELPDRFSIPLRDFAYGNVFTHSHPTGLPFSPHDLLVFGAGFAEFRAVTADSIYRLRAGNRPFTRRDVETWLTAWAVRAKNEPWYAGLHGNKTPDTARTILERLNPEFADAFGFQFERIPR